MKPHLRVTACLLVSGAFASVGSVACSSDVASRPPRAGGLESAAPSTSGAAARDAFARGQTASAAGDLIAARHAYAQALELAPDFGLAALELGCAELTLDASSPRALEALRRAVQLMPASARAHMQLAAAYEGAQRPADAVRHYAEALRLRADAPEASFRYAAALEASGELDQARSAYETTLGHDPRHTGALIALATLHERMGDRRGAETRLLELTRLIPPVAYNWVRLAQFYERVGDTTKAQRAYAEAERIDPTKKRKMRSLSPGARGKASSPQASR